MKNSSYWLFEKEQREVRAYLDSVAGVGVTNDHYKLKTSERGANPEHCREVVLLAMKLGEKGMKSILARYGCTTKQLLRAATGRPRKNSRASDKVLAESKSGTILNDLRKAAGRQVKASTYVAGKIKHPESGKSIADELEAIAKFAEAQQAVIDKREAAATKRKTAPANKATKRRASK